MYSFNQNLLVGLDKILGKSYTDISVSAGLKPRRLYRWISEQGMSVSDFVEFLNKYRLSMADFLITSENKPVDWRKETYVIPMDIWSPIQWNPSSLLKIFEKENAANVIDKTGLAKVLGFASYTSIDRWIDEGTMKLKTFIEMLNKLQLDAKDFIDDPNKVIGCPNWAPEQSYPVGQLKELLESQKKLQAMVRERDSLIADMQTRIKELKKENQSLKDTLRNPMAAEPAVPKIFGRKEYVFNSDLWMALPDVFGITKAELCRVAGIWQSTYGKYSVSMDALIKVCNEFRMSITHFFVLKGEPVVVHHRSVYEISKHLFVPIEDRSENLDFILKNVTSGVTVQKFCKASGIHNGAVKNFSEEGSKKRTAQTVAHICNTLGVPVSLFFQDLNIKGKASHAGSLNETLVENCVALYKELQELKNLKKE